MATSTLIFLRHADTHKDPNMNAALWTLSEEGAKQAEEVVNLDVVQEVDVIYVSEHIKTSLTVEPLENKLGKDVIPLAYFNEVKQGDAFLSPEEFAAEKVRQLQDLDYKAFGGGEAGNEALARFQQGIEKISQDNDGKTVLIVTHGTVLNLYFADILDVRDQLPERWKKTGFCAYGVVENGTVTKDIIS